MPKEQLPNIEQASPLVLLAFLGRIAGRGVEAVTGPIIEGFYTVAEATVGRPLEHYLNKHATSSERS